MLKVLISCDGSKCSTESIEDLQKSGLPAAGVEAVVMSVADVLPNPSDTDSPKLNSLIGEKVQVQVDEALAEARSIAREGQNQLARLFPGWRSTSEVVADSPYWGLVQKAQEWQADLVVVGSHGRSAPGRLLFGSTSQNVVLYADCSVRIGRCSIDRSESSDEGIRVIVGWDGSTHAEAAIHAVSQRHWPAGTAIRLVTALDTRLYTSVFPSGGLEYLEQQARIEIDKLRAAGLLVDDLVQRIGDPSKILVSEANTWKADCIFVGAKGLGGIARILIGSVSSSVTARARCSVEVIRPRKPV